MSSPTTQRDGVRNTPHSGTRHAILSCFNNAENERFVRRIRQMNTKPNLKTPQPKCPGCGMLKNQWPGEGYTHDGQTWCCQGCAEGTGCTCRQVRQPGFSREGQKRTRAEPRAAEQRAGAPAPQGELSGQRDSIGTAEAMDESACSRPLPQTRGTRK